MKNVVGYVSVLMIFVSGCSSLGGAKTDEEIVAQLGQEWIEALVKKDFAQAWSYTSPAFRSSNTVLSYKRRVAGAINWTGGAIETVSCEETRCEVSFTIDYSLPRYQIDNSRVLENVWIKVDGKWWIYQK